ncbi:RDD family protein [Amycolatopsis minnesotensis]|uniref:RDD domain-containing protein n=1 Tax=Amycolatopsis minnesotensis TaxID=337894 RepID=A0ABN2RJ52_9PSEU
MRDDSDLVTGDAVVLELHLATLASRGVAFVLDALVQVAVLLLTFLALLLTGLSDRSLAVAVLLSVLVLVRVGYPVLFEALNHGRTLGKMALGLRVVRDDGGPIRFRHALARGLAGAVVDFGPAFVWAVVGMGVSLCSSRSKRIGDFLAGTVVLRDRLPETPAPVLVMPPPLAQWASRLDLSGIDDGLALAIRQYLGRFHDLRPEAAHELGRAFTADVVAAIGTPVPEGVPDWAYLSAVLAERSARASRAAVPAVPAVPAVADSAPEPSAPEPRPENPFAPPS